MIIIPAIDLKDGKCVRLRQGRADDSKIYSDDPVRTAMHWQDQGAEYLHVVDLDGAFEGRPVHTSVIAEIAEALSIPVETGGGLRTDEDIRQLTESGVARAIIGTRAFEHPDQLRELADRFGPALAVGIDAKDGMVQVKGWVETTKLKAVDLARDAAAAGVSTLIVTDTATDGMMKGVNAEGIAEVCAAVNCGVIASGGISSIEDIDRLSAINSPNLSGAIVGKALYENTVTLQELKARARSGCAA